MSELYHIKKKKKESDENKSDGFGGAINKVNSYINKKGKEASSKTNVSSLYTNEINKNKKSSIKDFGSNVNSGINDLGSKTAEKINSFSTSAKSKIHMRQVQNNVNPPKHPTEHDGVVYHNPPKTLRKRLNATRLKDIVAPKGRR